MEKQTPNKPAPVKLSPVANLILAGAGIGLSYAAVSTAIDTGSLLMYAATLILFGMGVRNLVQAYQGWKKK